MLRVLMFSVGFSLIVSSAYAAGTTANLPEPDPTAKTLTPDGIRMRAQDACMVLQGEMMAVPMELVRDKCSCYARRTVSKMNKAEIEAFRNTGYFSDTAREKALESLDVCKLKRPV